MGVSRGKHPIRLHICLTYNNVTDGLFSQAPDIPGIPPGTKEDGTNYLAFLVVLRNLLGPNKSISVAAASSYWYLRGFPIDQIADVVDYVVFLTYDLHGQASLDTRAFFKTTDVAY